MRRHSMASCETAGCKDGVVRKDFADRNNFASRAYYLRSHTRETGEEISALAFDGTRKDHTSSIHPTSFLFVVRSYTNYHYTMLLYFEGTRVIAQECFTSKAQVRDMSSLTQFLLRAASGKFSTLTMILEDQQHQPRGWPTTITLLFDFSSVSQSFQKYLLVRS